ncbi:hypothetical protein IFR05_017092 [Cadophora sp. M221]|nr:hypothetical protein IFR05_017092 [Cadophora sp. M221]
MVLWYSAQDNSGVLRLLRLCSGYSGSAPACSLSDQTKTEPAKGEIDPESTGIQTK